MQCLDSKAPLGPYSKVLPTPYVRRIECLQIASIKFLVIAPTFWTGLSSGTHPASRTTALARRWIFPLSTFHLSRNFDMPFYLFPSGLRIACYRVPCARRQFVARDTAHVSMSGYVYAYLQYLSLMTNPYLPRDIAPRNILCREGGILLSVSELHPDVHPELRVCLLGIAGQSICRPCLPETTVPRQPIDEIERGGHGHPLKNDKFNDIDGALSLRTIELSSSILALDVDCVSESLQYSKFLSHGATDKTATRL